jgi:hypothetical protein
MRVRVAIFCLTALAPLAARGQDGIQSDQARDRAVVQAIVQDTKLARVSESRSLTRVEFPNLSMAPRLSDLTGEVPYAMAVSAPVYAGDKSLVYVQFGHGYNGYTCLTLLGYSTANAWRVESEVVVSIGN